MFCSLVVKLGIFMNKDRCSFLKDWKFDLGISELSESQDKKQLNIKYHKTQEYRFSKCELVEIDSVILLKKFSDIGLHMTL